MSTPTPHLDRFVRAVRWRAALLRVTESVGLGVAIGAGVAGVWVGVLLARGQDGTTAALGVVVAGALAGAARGLTHRPTTLAAAGEADRQLRLHDLLSTALSVRSAPDGWAQLVAAQADGRARSLRPRDVILHRFGARAWGGIGVATAMAAILTALSARPDDARATANPSPRAPSGTAVARDDSTPDQARAARRSSHVEASSARSSADTIEDSSTTIARSTGTAAAASTAELPGDGAAAARTANSSSNDPPTTGHRSPHEGATNPGAGDGATSTSETSSRAANPGRVNDTTAAPSLTETPLSPFTVPERDAGSTVHLDSIPDAYRDVVRAYFDGSSR